MKVETNIITGISDSLIGRAVIILIMNLNTFKYNLIKIRSLTCFPLQICRAMGDLRKPHYWSHASDLMS